MSSVGNRSACNVANSLLIGEARSPRVVNCATSGQRYMRNVSKIVVCKCVRTTIWKLYARYDLTSLYMLAYGCIEVLCTKLSGQRYVSQC
jgi:hypothetical protein